ncbi:MAG: hypothetical protein AAFO79_00745 [Pseudomonadota bacterium]
MSVALADQARTTYSQPSLEISGLIDSDSGRGELALLVPAFRPTAHSLIFLGLDGMRGADVKDHNTKRARLENIGAYLGVRGRIGSSGAVGGLWGGVDRFTSRYGNHFTRAIFGVDFVGSHLIARANGFAPIKRTSADWQGTGAEAGYTFREVAPAGVAGEIGLRFDVAPFEDDLQAGELRLFLGGYQHFGFADDHREKRGVQGRVSLDLYPFHEATNVRLTLTANGRRSAAGDAHYEAGVRLAIPLSGIDDAAPSPASLAFSDRRSTRDFYRPIRRDRMAVTQRNVVAAPDAVQAEGNTNTPSRTSGPLCGGPGAAIPGIDGFVIGDTITLAPFSFFPLELEPLTVSTGPFAGSTLEQVIADPNPPASVVLTRTDQQFQGFLIGNAELMIDVDLTTATCTGSLSLTTGFFNARPATAGAPSAPSASASLIR